VVLGPKAESTPFHLESVQLFVGNYHQNVLTWSALLDLDAATFVSLTFTNQKNFV
jgi:hypothetical protein